MPRAKSLFRESDMVRLIKAAQKAGLTVAGVGFRPDGSIFVEIGAPEEKQRTAEGLSLREMIEQQAAEIAQKAKGKNDPKKRCRSPPRSDRPSA